MLNFKLITFAALVCTGAAAFAEAPRKVVSMNVCTDQMAMMIAAEGQLHSVSTLAFDPRSSAMSDEAQGFVQNAGRAEEVYLMEPDLVLAGSFSARAAVDMLERLGVRVIRFEPAYSLADVSERLRQMGRALGREARAEELVKEFEAGLAALRAAAPEKRPRAIQYVANGFTQGDNTLSDEMIEAAGFANVAAELGIALGARMPLELLAMSAPDLVITSQPYPGASRSEEIPLHPVVAAVTVRQAPVIMSSRDWLCGTPYVLRAISDLAQNRETMGNQ